MPIYEIHQTNTLREAFKKDSIVISKDKLILLIRERFIEKKEKKTDKCLF